MTGLVKVLAGACLTLPVAMFQVILIRPPAQESILLAALPETVTKAVLSAWEAERSGLARSLTWEAKYPRVSVMDLVPVRVGQPGLTDPPRAILGARPSRDDAVDILDVEIHLGGWAAVEAVLGQVQLCRTAAAAHTAASLA